MRAILCWAAGLMLMHSAAVGASFAQDEPRERTRQPPVDEQPRADGREGGIPRSQLDRDRAGDRGEGQEEGVPEVRPQIAPGGGARWIAPRSEWKLGVWGYSTDSGVVVTRVSPGSAAARAGIESGDKIVTVGGYQIGYVGDLLYPLGFELQRHAGRRGNVLLLVQNVRNEELMHLTVQLDRYGRDRPIPLPMPLERP